MSDNHPSAAKQQRQQVLIVGAEGQIGAALHASLLRQGVPVLGTTRQRARADAALRADLRAGLCYFDLAEPDGALALDGVGAVVVCAAISNIAQCDNEAERCERINVRHTIALMERCAAAGCFIVFLSSNAVFDGAQPFYANTDTPAPVNNYGRFKLAVERHLQAAGNAAVVRLTKVVGPGNPLLERWQREAAAGTPITAFRNKLLSPVPLERVVEALCGVIRWREAGLFQLGGAEELSFYDYARQFFAGQPAALALLRAADDPAAPSGFPTHNSLTTHMPNTCHACHQHALQPIASEHHFKSVTSDCRPWNYPLHLAVCASCGLVQKRITPEYRQTTVDIYKSYAIYKQSDGAEQAVFSSQGVEFARSDKIIDWLGKQTALTGAGDLLEIGCGNGSFLKKFSARHTGWQLTGTEFDSKNQHLVEAIPRASFHCGELDQIDRKFDLIVAIHLLEHIFDPMALLKECAQKLTEDGKIFLQVPNVKESPFDILIADHCSHFSLESMISLLTGAGFTILAISDTNVPKELSLVVRPPRAAQRVDTGALEALVDGHLSFFGGLKEAGLRTPGPLGIFGSSISATWLASELEGRIGFFIDEDSNRIGKTHMGLPIVAVADVPAGAAVLLPMNPAIAQGIVKRLAASGIRFISPAE